MCFVTQLINEFSGIPSGLGWSFDTIGLPYVLDNFLLMSFTGTRSSASATTLYARRIGAIFGMLSPRAGLSATAGLSC